MLSLPSLSALQNLPRWLVHRFAPQGRTRPITTREQLISFLDDNAAYIAQKCAYAYCHARMGKLAYDALKEPYFQDKMEVCRWEGYAVILSDLVLNTALLFQERLGANAPPTKEFEQLYRDVLALHPIPKHRKDWCERQKAFGRRIASAMDMALKNRPLSVKQIASVGGKALFDLVPMGQIFKDNDKEIFFSTVRLCQMNADDDLRTRCNPKQIWNENSDKNSNKSRGKP